MNNIFKQNSLNAIVFKLQEILLIIESQKVAITHLANGIDIQVSTML